MCLIIDANVLVPIFKQSAQDHSKFEPVYDWIFNGNGKIVWGGTTYKKELENCKGEYRKLFTLLGKYRKTILIPADKVDEIEAILKHDFSNGEFKDFDDHHLASLIIASKCNIICTNDKRADTFLKNKRIYPKNVKVPKIYRSKRNKKLINDHNIVNYCKPAEKLHRDESEDTLTKFKSLLE